MIFEGRIYREGHWWLAEIPGLNYLTQGRTEKEALAMARDVVETGIDQKNVLVKIQSREKGRFTLTASNTNKLIALMLRRLRQKHGLTVREVSARMGSSSPNAFGAYEQGRIAPTLEKLEGLVRAIDPTQSVVLKIA